jgi:RNA polymerase sigma-70 factor (ECF subfamily)
MGIGCLEVPQACSHGVLPMVGAAQFPEEVRRGTPGRIDLCAARHLNSHRRAAPRHLDKDWAVVQQALAGNADAQEHLFAPHSRKLYRIAFGLLHNKEDAEDAVQDGLCKAFTSLRSFQGRSSFSTWLTRIVINSALMARRRKRFHSEASLDEILDGHPEQLPRGIAKERPDPERIYAENEIQALIEEHVRQLPPTLQVAFRLQAINGLSVTESSQALGIRANAFKSRVSRARSRLAYALQRSLEVSAIALVLRKRGQRKVKV